MDFKTKDELESFFNDQEYQLFDNADYDVLSITTQAKLALADMCVAISDIEKINSMHSNNHREIAKLAESLDRCSERFKVLYGVTSLPIRLSYECVQISSMRHKARMAFNKKMREES